MHIDQVLPTLAYGDAVSNNAIYLMKIIKEMGYNSRIYAENIDKKVAHLADPFSKYKPKDKDILIFHMSTGSDLSYEIKKLPNKKIMIYHNITPPEYFEGYNSYLEVLTRKGREELAMLKDYVLYAFADSEYNKQELEQYGYSNVQELPLVIDFKEYETEPDIKIIDQLSDGRTNILFVGRIAPNKKQEDIIKIFYYYKKHIDQGARLFLIGSYNGMELYYKQLVSLVKSLDLDDVYFTGHITLNQIVAYYKVASVFLSMSEHEGFCVPLLESMYFNVPIIAYNSTAIPYTLGDAGILCNSKDYFEIAEMINIVVTNPDIKKRLVETQTKRLEYFNSSSITELFKNSITRIISDDRKAI